MLKLPQSIRECFPRYDKTQNAPKFNSKNGWKAIRIRSKVYTFLELSAWVLLFPCVCVCVCVCVKRHFYNNNSNIVKIKKEKSENREQHLGLCSTFTTPLDPCRPLPWLPLGVWGAGGGEELAGVEGSVAYSLHPPVFYFFLSN